MKVTTIAVGEAVAVRDAIVVVVEIVVATVAATVAVIVVVAEIVAAVIVATAGSKLTVMRMFWTITARLSSLALVMTRARDSRVLADVVADVATVGMTMVAAAIDMSEALVESVVTVAIAEIETESRVSVLNVSQ
jgi:hypothetical protein